MYSLSYFKENDHAKVLQFMHQHPFIILCGCTASGAPVATHVPVLFEERENKLILRGHFMKKTDHHLAFAENNKALAVFNGAHTYVSASWYSNQQQASTWNYLAVHASGKLKFVGEEELMKILRDTTAMFENNADSPASFEKLDPEYISKLINAIVGFEMEVENIDNVFKLSQNRDRESFEHITEKLKEQGGDAGVIASEMEKRTEELYPRSIS